MRQMLGLVTLLTVLMGSAAIAPPTHAEDADAPAADAAATVEVTVRDDRFREARVTVPVGTTVTWVHQGNNSHTISALDGSFDSGLLIRDDTFSHTFAEPGTYQYVCRQHLLQGMRGTITVEGPEPAAE
jgi:plastocyanin